MTVNSWAVVYKTPLPTIPHLIGQVPDADGSIIAGGNEDVFGGVCGQTPDASLCVSVYHGVGGGVLLSNLDDLAILRSHQDLSLPSNKQTSYCLPTGRALEISAYEAWLTDLSSAHRSDRLDRKSRLQLKRSASLHFLIPQFHSAALFSPAHTSYTH